MPAMYWPWAVKYICAMRSIREHPMAAAKSRPNDHDSRLLTPQLTNRCVFVRQNKARIPPRPAYDLRRESIVKLYFLLGRDVVRWGEPPTLLGSAGLLPSLTEVEPVSVRGDYSSSASGDTRLPKEPKTSGAQGIKEGSTETFSPQILSELPDEMRLPRTNSEVYGEYDLVRRGSMRVPGISIEEWNRLPGPQKKVQLDLYNERCAMRRKDIIHRLRVQMKSCLENTSCTSIAVQAGTNVRSTPENKRFQIKVRRILLPRWIGRPTGNER